MAYQYQCGYPSYQNGYQPPTMNYQQPQMQPQIPQAQLQNTGILYVDGDKGAEEFQMLPNTFAFLKSTDGKAVYFKQALANGSITCEKFVLGEMRPAYTNDFVTRAEFDDFVKSMQGVKENNYEQSDSKHAKNYARTTKLQATDESAGNN